MSFWKKNKKTNLASDQSYWSYVKRQFTKNKRALFAFYVMLFLASIALFAGVIANDKPLIMKYEGQWYTPVFKQTLVDFKLGQWDQKLLNADWKNLETEFAVWPLIPYVASNFNSSNSLQPPFIDKENQHWLGTDALGHDVTAIMIYGTRTAFLVGIVAMSIAVFIGIVIGGLAGFFGDDRLKMSRIRIILNLFTLPFAFFYGFLTRSYEISDALSFSFFSFLGAFFTSIFLFLGIMGLANVLAHFLKRIPWLGKKVKIPVDLLCNRLIELVVSIPILVLILAVVAVTTPSIYNIMLIIGLFNWTGIARFVRSELMRVRQLEYIEAANALGFSSTRTLIRHALPNSLTPVFITVAFGIAAAILIEAFLSFLGIGLPPDMITWGKLLSEGRSNMNAWWLTVLPGLAIFITVTVFNLIGEGLSDAIDPRLKQ